MSDKFTVYQPDGEHGCTYVTLNESVLSEVECVKKLNEVNNTCDKLTEENKMLREALAFCVPHAEFALQGQMFNRGMANAREVLEQTK